MTAISAPLRTYLTVLADQFRKQGQTAPADELLALIGEPVRQHVSEASCWCRPFRASNGAFDHRDVR